MEYRTLGKTGLRVSVIGFGSNSIAGADTATAGAVIGKLLDGGVTLLDTAACYGCAEERIGEALGARRKDVVIVTKCGHHEVLPDGRWRSRAISMADVDLALRRLRTDVIDVMLLHSYDREPLVRGDAVKVLAAARDAGKIRFLGYSGDNETAALAAAMADISVIETSVSIADQANIRSVLPVARRHNVGVQAKRSMANAAWRFMGGGAPDGVRVYAERLRAMEISPASLSEAEMAWGELALRFTLSIEGVQSALVGTANPSKIQENLGWAEKGPLPRQMVERITAAFRAAEGLDAKAWSGQN